MTFGSLFAGIGGMDLGLERAGMECAWQVEIDDYARRVLAKHWPDVRRHDDVKTFPPTAPEDWHCDIICGGFPCQDISNAGKRAGIDGARSGLWSEYARIIRVVRPRYVLVENVSALLHRGLGRVLGDLAEIGYDAEWHCIPASYVGASHQRDRVWIVAHTDGQRHERRIGSRVFGQRPDRPGVGGKFLDLACDDGGEELVANTDKPGLEIGSRIGRNASAELPPAQRDDRSRPGMWLTEPDVGRVAHGIPRRVDRLRGLGNAVVPQVSEYLGRMIMVHAEGR